jgi:hypothetical protein
MRGWLWWRRVGDPGSGRSSGQAADASASGQPPGKSSFNIIGAPRSIVAGVRDNLFFIRHEDATPYTFRRKGYPASVWAWESIRALRDGVYVWADEASAEDVTGVCVSPVYVWAGGARAEDVTGACASPLGGARSHTSNKERTLLCLSTIRMS